MVCSSKFGGDTSSNMKEVQYVVEIIFFLYDFYIEIWNTIERIENCISLSFS